MPISPLRTSIEDRKTPIRSAQEPERPGITDVPGYMGGGGGDVVTGYRATNLGLEAGTLLREANYAELARDESLAQGDERNALRQEQISRDLTAQAEHLQAGTVAPRVSSFGEVNNVGDFADFFQAQAVGSMAATMGPAVGAAVPAGLAATALTGNPLVGAAAGIAAGAGVSFPMEAGEQAASQHADPYIRDNVSALDKIHAQNTYATVASIFENVPGVGMLGGRTLFKPLARKLAKEATEATSKKAFARTRAVALESQAEGAVELSQTIAGQHQLDKLNPNRDRSGDSMERIDAYMAAMMGLGSISVATSVPGYAAEKLGARRARAQGGQAIPDDAIRADTVESTGEAGIEDRNLRPGLYGPDSGLDPNSPDQPNTGGPGDGRQYSARSGRAVPIQETRESFIPEDVARTAAQALDILDNSEQHPPGLVEQASQFLTTKQQEYGVASVLDLMDTEARAQAQAQQTQRQGGMPDVEALQSIDDGGTQLELDNPVTQPDMFPEEDGTNPVVADDLTAKLIGLTDPDILKTRKPWQVKQAKKEALEMLRENFPEVFAQYDEDSSLGKAQKLGKFRKGGTRLGPQKPKPVNREIASLDDFSSEEIQAYADQFAALSMNQEEATYDADEGELSGTLGFGSVAAENDPDSIFHMANKDGIAETQELEQLSGAQQKGQFTPLVNRPGVIDKFLGKLVRENRITQRVADTVEKQPLGDYIVQKYANKSIADKKLKLKHTVNAARRDVARRLEKSNVELKYEKTPEGQKKRQKNIAHLEAQLRVLDSGKADHLKLNIYAMLLGSSADTTVDSLQTQKDKRATLDKKTQATAKDIEARTVRLIAKNGKTANFTTDDLARIGWRDNPSETPVSKERAIILGINGLWGSGLFTGFINPNTGKPSTSLNEIRAALRMKPKKPTKSKATKENLAALRKRVAEAKTPEELRKAERDLGKVKRTLTTHEDKMKAGDVELEAPPESKIPRSERLTGLLKDARANITIARAKVASTPTRETRAALQSARAKYVALEKALADVKKQEEDAISGPQERSDLPSPEDKAFDNLVRQESFLKDSDFFKLEDWIRNKLDGLSKKAARIFEDQTGTGSREAIHQLSLDKLSNEQRLKAIESLMVVPEEFKNLSAFKSALAADDSLLDQYNEAFVKARNAYAALLKKDAARLQQLEAQSKRTPKRAFKPRQGGTTLRSRTAAKRKRRGQKTELSAEMIFDDAFEKGSIELASNGRAPAAMLAKDQQKSNQATKFIGRGVKGSSTDSYRESWGDRANSGVYESKDTVFVSVNGKGQGRLSFDKAEIAKAAEAGVTFITDKPGTRPGQRNSSYNIGEAELAQHLVSIGYKETKPGVWNKAQSDTVGQYSYTNPKLKKTDNVGRYSYVNPKLKNSASKPTGPARAAGPQAVKATREHYQALIDGGATELQMTTKEANRLTSGSILRANGFVKTGFKDGKLIFTKSKSKRQYSKASSPAGKVQETVYEALVNAGFKFIDPATAPDIAALRMVASKTLRKENVRDVSTALSFLVYNELGLQSGDNKTRKNIQSAIETWIKTGKNPTEVSSSLWAKVREVLKRLQAFFSSKKYIALEARLSKELDRVLRDPKRFAYKQELGKQRTSFQKLISKNPVVHKVFNTLNSVGADYVLTGSMAYADQTAVYRNMNTPIHDVDLIYNSAADVARSVKALNAKFGAGVKMYEFTPKDKSRKVLGMVYPSKKGQKVVNYKKAFVNTKKGIIPTRSWEVVDAQGKTIGTFKIEIAPDGSSKDVTTGDFGFAVDFILQDHSRNVVNQSYTAASGETVSVQVSNFVDGFLAKLESLRNKDINDLKAATPNTKQFSKAAGYPPPNSAQVNRLKKNLAKRGKRLIFDPNSPDGPYKVVDSNGRPDAAETRKVQKSMGSAGAYSNYKTLEEALKNPDIKKRRDAVVKYMKRAFGEEYAKSVEFLLFKDTEKIHAGGYDGVFDHDSDVIQVAIDSLDPLSIAFHESMHRFALALSKTELGRDLHRRLEKAASSIHMRKQLRDLLKDHPEKLGQLDDVNERIAYMFQFYAASKQLGGPAFKMHSSNNVVQHVIQALTRFLGMITHSAASEQIFESLYSGSFHEEGINPLAQYKSKKVQEVLEHTYRSLSGSMGALLSTPITRVKAMEIPALTDLMERWYADPLAHQGSGVLQRTQQMARQFRVQYREIVKKTGATPAQLRAASDNLAAMKKPANKLEKELKKFFDVLYGYSQDGDTPVMRFDGIDGQGNPQWSPLKKEHYSSKGHGYFPRHWDIDAIRSNESEFRRLLTELGGLEDAAIDDFLKNISRSDGAVEQAYRADFSPFMSSVNKRVFDFINPSNAELFVEFQQRDTTKVIDNYIRDVTHRREHARAFGSEGKETKRLLEQAKREGATDEQIDLALKAVQGLEGRLGTDKVSDTQQQLQVAAMSIVNFAILPLALFASLMDPAGVLVRTGSLKSAAKTFVAGVRQIVNDTRGKSSGEMQKLAEYIGSIENDMAMDIMNNTEDGLYMNEKLRKLNSYFFKAIGLEQWTRGTRIGALRASISYLLEHKDNPKALAELGLERGDIVSRTDVEGNESMNIRLSEFTGGDRATSRERARRVQNALYRLVDESILRPSAGTRPLWMSDQRFLLLGHLKQFTFTYHNTMVKQVMTRFKENRADGENWAQASLAAAPLLAYVPIMMAADILRSMAAGKWDDEDDDRSFIEMVGHAIQRSTILGNSTFLLDLDDDLDYGGLPVNTLLGPVAEKGFSLANGVLDPDASFTIAARNLLPFSAMWKGWLQ